MKGRMKKSIGVAAAIVILSAASFQSFASACYSCGRNAETKYEVTQESVGTITNISDDGFHGTLIDKATGEIMEFENRASVSITIGEDVIFLHVHTPSGKCLAIVIGR